MQEQGPRREAGTCKCKCTGDALAGVSARANANAVAKCFSSEWASKKAGARVVARAVTRADVFSVLCAFSETDATKRLLTVDRME